MAFEGLQHSLGVWIAGFLSLTIFSFLYRDNPVYKVAEHLFLGTALGYSLSLYYWQSIWPNAIAPVFAPAAGEERNMTVLIPMVLGLFVLLRIVPRLGWLSRYSFAVYIGGGVGIAVPTVLAGTFLPQLIDTMKPLWTVGAAGNAGATGAIGWQVLTGLLTLVGVFATLLYFFYSLEHRGALGAVSRVGVFFLMLGFGASFGNTVMARISVLIGRFQFLITDWPPMVALLRLFGLGGGP
jgi:hypothetical protein